MMESPKIIENPEVISEEGGQLQLPVNDLAITCLTHYSFTWLAL